MREKPGTPNSSAGSKRVASACASWMCAVSRSRTTTWRAVLEQATACLLPDGELHIVDFGRQERLPGWFKAALRRWLALFHVHPRDDLEAELAQLAARHGFSLAIERPYGGYAQHAILSMAPLPVGHWQRA